MTPGTAIAWIQAHPAECWLALSAVLNVAFRLRTPERWVALCERRPALAAVLGLVRALGIDPAGAMKAVALVANTKAAHSSIGALTGDSAPPTPRDPSAAPPPDVTTRGFGSPSQKPPTFGPGDGGAP
jgi:hypothetical protein